MQSWHLRDKCLHVFSTSHEWISHGATQRQQDPAILLARGFGSVSMTCQQDELFFRLKIPAVPCKEQYNLISVCCRQTLRLREQSYWDRPKPAALSHSKLVMGINRESMRMWQVQSYVAFHISILPLAKHSFGLLPLKIIQSSYSLFTSGLLVFIYLDF